MHAAEPQAPKAPTRWLMFQTLPAGLASCRSSGVQPLLQGVHQEGVRIEQPVVLGPSIVPACAARCAWSKASLSGLEVLVRWHTCQKVVEQNISL